MLCVFSMCLQAVIERLRELGPNQRYVDPEFAGSSALYISEHDLGRSLGPIQWRRPTVSYFFKEITLLLT